MLHGTFKIHVKHFIENATSVRNICNTGASKPIFATYTRNVCNILLKHQKHVERMIATCIKLAYCPPGTSKLLHWPARGSRGSDNLRPATELRPWPRGSSPPDRRTNSAPSCATGHGGSSGLLARAVPGCATRHGGSDWRPTALPENSASRVPSRALGCEGSDIPTWGRQRLARLDLTTGKQQPERCASDGGSRSGGPGRWQLGGAAAEATRSGGEHMCV
jgi:hypothetical protein